MSSSKMNESGLVWENDEVQVLVPYSIAGVSTSILISSKFTGKSMLLDVGDGLLRYLAESENFDFVEELTTIAITHGHFDHMGGLHSILGFLRMLDRGTPLDVLAPKGCQEVRNVIHSFKQVYGASLPFGIRRQEVTHFTEFDTDFFKINVYEVEHFGMENTSSEDVLMPAVGYRVTVGSTVIAYTGDSRMCSALEDLVRDADLALIEATREKTPSEGSRVHLSKEEAENLGSLAKDYRLIHRLPSFMRE